MQPRNLEVTHPRPDVVVELCRICGAKHYRMLADPGKLGLTLKGLGKEKADV